MSKRRKTWVLPETKKQAVARWRTIAEAIAEVSESTVNWAGGKEALARFMLTVVYHESGFSLDCHDGSWRGDCNKYGRNCRSSCLGQILVGKRVSQFTKLPHEQLVGTDKASTIRCLRTVARYLVSAQTMCRSRWANTSATGAQCIFGAYGGVRDPTIDKRIYARVRTLRKLTARRWYTSKQATR